MGPAQAISTCLRKYATFSGRASRSEYWWFAPLWLLIAFVIHSSFVPLINSYIGSLITTKTHIMWPFFLLIILCVPILSASSRRATDTGYDIIWVGWGFSAIFFGFGLNSIATLFPDSNTSWMPAIATIMAAIGGLALLFILTHATNTHIKNEGHDQ